jgi:hypothetical protein
VKLEPSPAGAQASLIGQDSAAARFSAPAPHPQDASVPAAEPPRQILPPVAGRPGDLSANLTRMPGSQVADKRSLVNDTADFELMLASPPGRQPVPALDPAGARAIMDRTTGTDPTLAGPTPGEADRLFLAKQYIEAGHRYAALAYENRLPANRKNHWAYCRMVEVAQRLNARPRSAKEWDEIESEIQRIQKLAPNLWYGEYLRNKLAEVRPGRRRPPAKTDNLVIRGSAPEEDQVGPRRPFAPALKGAQPKVDPEDLRAENESAAPGGVAWQVHETLNFRIYHADPALAEAAARVAEETRAVQAKVWGSPALNQAWNPRCDIHLYPNGKAFAQATGQPENSPGFSTMNVSGGRVTARSMSVRADHAGLLKAILPHELTHVVLADLFTAKQIPRWADEGMAVLAEPSAQQSLRASELEEPLQAARLFELSNLMSMDYPEAKDWSLYYAQSVSLTRFLVEQATPERFLQFVQNANGTGIEAALRDLYQIRGFAELQDRWLTYARDQVATIKQARKDSTSPERVTSGAILR